MDDLARTDNSEIANRNEFVNFEETFKRISEQNYNNRNTKTDPNIVRVREGKKGQTYSYITRADAHAWLDKHYPIWSWVVDPESFKEFAGAVQVAGTLTVMDPITGAARSIKTYGSDDIELVKDTGKPVNLTYAKNADTDAFKRAVYTLGGFQDVYTGRCGEDRDTASEEDLQWFIEKVIPAARAADMPYDRIIHRLMSFRDGIITRDYIAKQLHIQE